MNDWVVGGSWQMSGSCLPRMKLQTALLVSAGILSLAEIQASEYEWGSLNPFARRNGLKGGLRELKASKSKSSGGSSKSKSKSSGGSSKSKSKSSGGSKSKSKSKSKSGSTPAAPTPAPTPGPTPAPTNAPTTLLAGCIGGGLKFLGQSCDNNNDCCGFMMDGNVSGGCFCTNSICANAGQGMCVVSPETPAPTGSPTKSPTGFPTDSPTGTLTGIPTDSHGFSHNKLSHKFSHDCACYSNCLSHQKSHEGTHGCTNSTPDTCTNI